MYMTYACQQQQNFINCPTFENTTHCAKTMEIVTSAKECTIKYKDHKFIRQDFWFFEEPDDENDWLDCVIWQLF